MVSRRSFSLCAQHGRCLLVGARSIATFHRKRTILIETTRNCGRATEREEEACSETVGRCKKNQVQGTAKWDERTIDRKLRWPKRGVSIWRQCVKRHYLQLIARPSIAPIDRAHRTLLIAPCERRVVSWLY